MFKINHQLKRSAFLGFLCFSTFALVSTVSAQNSSSRIRYNPPSTLGQPRASIAGAVRGCNSGEESCPVAIMPGVLTSDVAMLPSGKLKLNHYPTTISDRPTFYIYLPKIKGDLRFRLFKESLERTETEPQKIYQTKQSIDHQDGIISFTLPVDAPRLELNQTYRWDVLTYGKGNDIDNRNSVEGVLQRIPLSSELIQQLNRAQPLERASIYAKSGIWFETVNTLVDFKCSQSAKSNSTESQAAWTDLLTSVNLEAIAKQPVDCSPSEY